MQSLELYQAFNLPQEIAVVLKNLGNIHIRRGEYSEAIDYYNRELQIHQDTNNRIAIGGVLNNLGVVYMRIGDYSKAESYLNRSVKIDRELETLGGLANDLDSLGTLYLLTDRFQEAEKVFRESLKIINDIGYDQLLPYVLNGLGRALYKQGMHEEGSRYSFEALARAETANDEVALVSIATSCASIKLDKNLLGDAEELLVKAVTLADKLDLQPEKLSSLVKVARFLDKQGETQLALQLVQYIQEAPEIWCVTKCEIQDLVKDWTSNSSKIKDPITRPSENYAAPLYDLVYQPHFSPSGAKRERNLDISFK